jgi:hypothetical protein
VSSGLVEDSASSFLPNGLIPNGMLVCETEGFTAVVPEMQVDPRFWCSGWRDTTRAASVLLLILEIFEVVDIERGL